MSDLLHRLVERLQQTHPALSDEEAARLEQQLRIEFGGATGHILHRHPAVPREQIPHEVRRRFNGRNAMEIARALNIGKSSVYRYLKTAGDTPPPRATQ